MKAIPTPLPPCALALALLAIGCGSAGPKPTSTARAATGKTAPSGRSRSSSDAIAARARDATLQRRGSWSATSDRVRAVAPHVSAAAAESRVPEDLVFGIIWVESRFNPRAVSPVGAQGLMQLMPKTADYLAERISWKGSHDSFDPEFNITAGTYYIARLIETFDGDVDLALAAYNAGPTNVKRWLSNGGLPRVSVEYHTMVQTARGFFRGAGRGAPGGQVPTDDELDRLGLAILIAGLSDREFGLDRPDDAAPLD